MAALGAEQVAEIVTGLTHMRNVNYLHVASLAILTFDTFLTLDIEINFIWNAPWNIIKVLYLVTKYPTFIDTSLNVLLQFIPGASESTCKTLYQAGTWIILTGMCLAELIMAIRTWAVWGKTMWLGIALLIFFVGTWAAGFTVVGLLSGPYTFVLQDALHPFLKGCLVTGGRVGFLQITWVLLFVYDGVIMLLMLIPAYEVLRGGGQSKLVRVVFRDVRANSD
ncbi:hypothetical protein BDQ17DRAFT_1412002 [Cyathus striatus]|nr:hypothetical protein BDQ17DRAFT_1412002 [Cyathus striatus]